MCLFKKDNHRTFRVLIYLVNLTFTDSNWLIGYAMQWTILRTDWQNESSLIFARPIAVPEILSIFLHAQSFAEKKAAKGETLVRRETPVVTEAGVQGSYPLTTLFQKWVKKHLHQSKNDLRAQIQIDAIDLKVQPIFYRIWHLSLQRSSRMSGWSRNLKQALWKTGTFMVSAEMSYNDGEIESTRKW